MKEIIQKAAVLIEAMPYMQRFKNSIFVVKFGGSVLENQALSESALKDIVFLSLVGIRPVIVHGGGKEISSELEKLNIPVSFIKGQRYTCKKTVRVVDEVLHNVINPRITSTIESYDGKAAMISGKTILTGHKLEEIDELKNVIDLGLVGEVSSVNTQEIKSMIKENIIPVITPLALDEDGKTLYNVNADAAAAKIAEALHAKKLIYISDVPGLLRESTNEESLISSIDSSEVEPYITNGIISGGMIPKIRSAMKAITAGTSKVHLIDGRIQHSILLEIFTDSGIGTQIVNNSLKQ